MVTEEGLLIGPQGALRANQQSLLSDHILSDIIEETHKASTQGQVDLSYSHSQL